MSKQFTAQAVPAFARAHIRVPDQSDIKHILYSHHSLEQTTLVYSPEDDAILHFVTEPWCKPTCLKLNPDISC